MTNTTEMPEKIWVDECYWYPAELVAKEQGEYRDNKLATYTRTDTIPSKAEVAREFVNNFNNRCYSRNTLGLCTITPAWHDCQEVINELLKEWEDAEVKI